VDKLSKTFLHVAAEQGSSEMMMDIVAVLPRTLAQQLCLCKDYSGRTPNDASTPYDEEKKQPFSPDHVLSKDHIEQAGSSPVETYLLLSLPKVLIFYNKIGRELQHTTEGEKTDAEKEKDCVEKYFAEKNVPTLVIEDATKADVLSIIGDVRDSMKETCLLVFIMAHGQKGQVIVSGENNEPDYLSVEKIMNHMCKNTEGKPKVREKVTLTDIMVFTCVFTLFALN
jgi:hypothetical protein